MAQMELVDEQEGEYLESAGQSGLHRPSQLARMGPPPLAEKDGDSLGQPTSPSTY